MRTCYKLLPFLSFIFFFFFTACGDKVPAKLEEAYSELPEKIDFNFHVRPILSDRCYSCHGPDENTREAGLRLDLEDEAFKALSSGNGYAFVAGKAGKSQSIERILSDDPEFQMPPPTSNLVLSEREKAILFKWIEEGAEWKEHWAFIPPEKSALPAHEKNAALVENEIDVFVQHALPQVGLEPAEKADKERLLRRLSMDVRGLPPSVEEMENFLKDEDPQAYEKRVDEFLNSDAYAERMAMEWMDISRYADSHGMHADGWRMMWPWRDWVIKAFQENMPYDQFATWQLAGDLMPNASRDQKLATAFNRNHPMTAEGGVIDEEFRLGYVFDRTETVSTAFLGLTVGCARCHDHKFDPISQKEYYQLTAFFNNVKELGMTGDDGNYGPMLSVADDETETKRTQLKIEIEKEEAVLKALESKLLSTKEYLKKLPKSHAKEARVGYYPFNSIRERKKSDGKRKFSNGITDGNAKYVIDNSTVSVSNGKASVVKGKNGNALELSGNYDEIYLQNIPNFEWTDAFSAGLWANTSKRKKGETQTLMGTSSEKNSYWRGWDFYLDTLNRLNARIIHSPPHNYLHFRSQDSIKINSWKHLAFSYNGSGKAKGFSLFKDGKKMKGEVVFDQLYKSAKSVAGGSHVVQIRSVRVGLSGRAFTGEIGAYKGLMDELVIYGRELAEIEVSKIAGIESADEPKDLLAVYWLGKEREVVAQKKKLKALRDEWLELSNEIPEVMVMEEMPEARTTFAYNRGEYDDPMYEVGMGTPEVLPAFSTEELQNRLGLAKWIFTNDNPLTARVTVNRYWQMIFGQGLVNTPQDFGVQGALPTHPELLDWLAVDFMENGWDLKALLKKIYMSHTYQQSSEIREKAKEIDPSNIWLARGSSYRLPAEMIRDNALAASGLLVQKVGGESVKPYQPEGLWIEKGNFSYRLLRYKVTRGDSLYRRSLYTFVKRTSPHPSMTAFDAPNRDICVVKRENTNTPLQALVLLNDPQFVEAARVLAERIQLEKEGDLEEQILYAFRLSTGRKAKPEEIKLLKELYEKQLDRFQNDPSKAKELLAYGEYAGNTKLEIPKTAALAVVSSTILNHDEAYMKR
ncbi:MAG: DUF1553 domain-containing protein [Bacteroidia bacterium]|nr:DUF1553 domain-containing protein [Bacteroidia bacterium]